MVSDLLGWDMLSPFCGKTGKEAGNYAGYPPALNIGLAKSRRDKTRSHWGLVFEPMLQPITVIN